MNIGLIRSCSQAGTIIAQEAGALVNTCDLSRDGGEVTGDMSGDVLTGRKYIVIRSVHIFKIREYIIEPFVTELFLITR